MISAGLSNFVQSILIARGWLSERTACRQKIADALVGLQSWAGLGITGELDRETLIELDAPRFCALPDVMPLAATLCKWPDGEIGYYVQDAFPGLSLDQTWAAFDWALALWAKAAKLKVGRTSSAQIARIVARVKRLDGPNGVLAQSQLPCGQIRQALQDYDSSEGWDRTIQAKLVIAHEVGHALGLEHAPGKGSLMSPYYDPSIGSLQKWDIDEIVKRYGAAAPQPQPTPAPTPAPTPSARQILIDVESKTIVAPQGWTIETR